ncbi:helix-turn-helix domain-containing protein [Pseudoclavibacter sp. 13-3]|uniref:helix-turn-helix domain-containing protein n=1 Tax=Pseudoclavibacter sp. 13-3 TaxID=2901228 RepID=UPI001E65D533|nr:AraC family transcriptional regulator [Pseudoclavibacter sp. 13-3]MCD7102237.1 AraC family transcriptional regulator [Pseudoclavibacter sp. 13-3]
MHSLFWPPTQPVELVVKAHRWRATPTQAVWIPAATRFRVEPREHPPLFRIAISAEPSHNGAVPDAPRVIPVTTALHDLILAYVTARFQGAPVDTDAIVAVIAQNSRPAVRLARPSSPEARALALSIEMNPASTPSLQDWAAERGLSPRTLLRQFRAEAGCTVNEYRLQARLRLGLQLLDEGRTLTEVANATGYSSPTSFVATFRRTFGDRPEAYGLGVNVHRL